MDLDALPNVIHHIGIGVEPLFHRRAIDEVDDDRRADHLASIVEYRTALFHAAIGKQRSYVSQVRIAYRLSPSRGFGVGTIPSDDDVLRHVADYRVRGTTKRLSLSSGNAGGSIHGI